MNKKPDTKWHETPFPGVRVRYHPTRKHGVKRDRYFAIRYQQGGVRREEGAGWASEGMSEKRAALLLAELREAARTGKGETSLAERRAKTTAAREREAAGKITFNTFWNETYLPHSKTEKTKDTMKRERSLFKQWLSPLLGPLPFPEISVIHLEKLKSKMNKAGLSPRSIQYGLAVTRQVINEARRRGIFMGDNVVSRVRSPKVDNRRMRFLTEAEAEALLAELKETDRETWEMTLLSLHCGLRAGEILGLTWGSIDTERGLIGIKDPKGHSRFSHMTQTVKEMLKAKGNGDPEALLFPGAGSRAWPEIPRTFARAVETLGLNEGREDPRDHIFFHSCRHTFASWLVQAGVDLYTVRELLGHKTLAMTMRYSHLAPENSQKAIAVLEAALENGKEKTQKQKRKAAQAD